jgi:hypothetical protein
MYGYDHFLSKNMYKFILVYLDIKLKFDPIWTMLEGSKIGYGLGFRVGKWVDISP